MARWTVRSAARGVALMAASLVAASPGCAGKPDAPPAPEATVTTPATAAPTTPTVAAPAKSNNSAAAPDGLANGNYAPDFDLAILGGKGKWKLSDHVRQDGGGDRDGAIVAFMASWCGYCAESLPTVKEVEDSLGDRIAVVILTVDADDDDAMEEANKVKAAGLKAPVLLVDDAIRQAWIGSSKSIPHFFFLNKVGEVLVQDRGFGAKVKPLLPKQAAMVLSHPTFTPR